MKVIYVKTIGFRKFRKLFETELYDTTSISGKNRSGKSNVLFAIINIILGTNLSGDEKACLINKNCDASYGELHFIDNAGIEHVLIRGKHRYDNSKNFVTLDGKVVTQKDLISIYKDKKLFLSILNPLYFLSKKPAEQKEMVDKYLSDIKPIIIFNTLTDIEQKQLIDKYFYISTKEIYHKLSIEELETLYYEHKLQELTGKEFTELTDKDKYDTICHNIKNLKGIKYYEILSPEEQESFINSNLFDIPMDVSYNNLTQNEKDILEGIPRDIPQYITEINGDIKRSEAVIASLDGKIEYAQNIADEKVPNPKTFEKDEELLLARQELAFLNTNQNTIDKEKQKQLIESLEKEILSKETEFNELENSMKVGKKKYLEIKTGVSFLCPTCAQYIQDESKKRTITNMYNDLVSKYDKRNLLETQVKDLKLKLATEKCKYHSLEGNPTIEKSKRIAIIEDNIKQLENEKLEIEKFNSEVTLKEQNIKNAKTDIENFNAERQSFIDDYESCADYDFIKDYAKNTQLIISKVEKGNLLKIEDYNNKDNYTIIRPIITGYKTMSINKNNVAEIQKAA